MTIVIQDYNDKYGFRTYEFNDNEVWLSNNSENLVRFNPIKETFKSIKLPRYFEVFDIIKTSNGKIILVGDFSPVSLMVIDNENSAKLPDPYKLDTPALMKKYTDYLLNLTNGD